MLKVETQKSIKKAFNKMIMFGIIADIIILLFGVVMLFNPDFTNKMIGTIIGILLLTYASSLIFNYFSREGAKIYSLNLIFGIIVGAISVLLIVYPYTVIDFVITCLAVYLIISGAVKVNYAVWLKKGKDSSFPIVIVNGIMLIVLGIILIVNPFANMAVTQLIGAFIIISSVLKIMSTMLFKNRAKEIMKIFW